MLKLFGRTSFDFMSVRRVFIVGSLMANALGLALFFTKGVNLGIDFTGGTELYLRFAATPDLASVRSALEGAGLRNPTVTTIGEPRDNELYIRVAAEGGAAPGAPGRDLTTKVVEAVRGEALRGLDLNLTDERKLRDHLQATAGLKEADAGSLAAAITSFRRDRGGIIASMDSLRGLPGMTDAAFQSLGRTAVVGPVALRAQSYVGPSVAPELTRKAVGAVFASMLAMLVYIALRFRFQWGLGAILALIHDVIITLGIYCLSGKEFSLPVVASFLTLVGYSVNDTIVVFDRIRENLRLKGAGDLARTINLSINQTLSRTVITSGLTWMVCVALFVFGGEVLNGFAFVLVVGIIIGTYSSVFIASPVIIFWEWLFSRRRRGAAEDVRGLPRKEQKAQKAP